MGAVMLLGGDACPGGAFRASRGRHGARHGDDRLQRRRTRARMRSSTSGWRCTRSSSSLPGRRRCTSCSSRSPTRAFWRSTWPAASRDGLLTAIGEAAPRWIITVGTLVVAVALREHAEGAARRARRALRGCRPRGPRHRAAKPARVRRDLRARGGARAAHRPHAEPACSATSTISSRSTTGSAIRAATRRCAARARSCASTNRRIDLVARVGGEEFAVLLPDSDERGAHIAAERMRQAIREGFAEDPVPLTISFGIASFPQHGDTTDDLMESADQALYTAKEIGRDCSVIYRAAGRRRVSGHARRRRARGEARLASLVTLAESLDSHEHSADGRPLRARDRARARLSPEDRLERLVLAGDPARRRQGRHPELDRDEARAAGSRRSGTRCESTRRSGPACSRASTCRRSPNGCSITTSGPTARGYPRGLER